MTRRLEINTSLVLCYQSFWMRGMASRVMWVLYSITGDQYVHEMIHFLIIIDS